MTNQELAAKVATARDVAYSMSNISGGPMWHIPQPPGKNKASIVLLAALDAQAAEIRRLQQQLAEKQAEVNQLKFYDGAFLIAKVGLEAILEKSTEQNIKDMVGRTFDIIRVGKPG